MQIALVCLALLNCAAAFTHIRSNALLSHRKFCRSSSVLKKSAPTLSLLAVPPKDEKNEEAKIGGMETKYVAAWALVGFGVLWDFFITHHGQVYLKHP